MSRTLVAVSVMAAAYAVAGPTPNAIHAPPLPLSGGTMTGNIDLATTGAYQWTGFGGISATGNGALRILNETGSAGSLTVSFINQSGGTALLDSVGLELGSAEFVNWSTAAAAGGTVDVALGRGAAGLLSVSTGNLATPNAIGDLTASCVTGQWGYDTGGVTDEICFCAATNTWFCDAVTAGPAD
jgi:hypothetical protein